MTKPPADRVFSLSRWRFAFPVIISFFAAAAGDCAVAGFGLADLFARILCRVLFLPFPVRSVPVTFSFQALFRPWSWHAARE